MKMNSALDGFVRFVFSVLAGAALCVAVFLAVRGYRTWIKTSPSFHVHRIAVTGNDLVSERDVLKLAGIPKGRSIWSLKLENSEQRIEANPFVQRAVVARRFPDGIWIRIEEKKPLVLLNAGGRLFSVDGNGILLPARSGKLYELPVVSSSLPRGVKPGQPILEESVIRCVDFVKLTLEKRPDLYPEISELVFDRSVGLTVYTRKKGVPVRMGADANERKIRILEAFLAEWNTNPEYSNVDYVDLRYEGQVVLGMGA